MKNIKTVYKLLIMVIIVGIVPLYASTLTTHFMEKKELIKSIDDKNRLFAYQTSIMIDNFLDQCSMEARLTASSENIITTLKTMLKSPTISNSSLSYIVQIADAILENENYLDFFLTDSKGNLAYSHEYPQIEGTDLSSIEYVNKALSSGEQAWSELTYSDLIKSNSMTICTPVYYETTLVGTVNITLGQTAIDNIVHKGLDVLGSTANSYLINADGLLYSNTMTGDYAADAALKQTISSEASSLLNTPITEGNTDYTYTGSYNNYTGNEVCGSLSVLKFGNTYTGLVIELDYSEASSAVNHIIGNLSILLTLIALVAIVASIFIAYTISKPISAMVKITAKIADYDISQDISSKYINRKDEIGSLGKSIQSITNKLRDLITGISSSSESVAASSEELTASSEQTATSSQELANTISEIARGASEQADNTNKGVDDLSKLGELVDKEAVIISKANESMNNVKTSVNEGLDIVNTLYEKNELSSKASGIVEESVRKTSESAFKIREASTMIADIASRTNLLSLNASIEAARAGDAGKGFAVVATEIQALADQSAACTRNIDEIITEIIKTVDIAVEKTKESVLMLNEQTAVVNTTADKFKHIASATEDTENAMKVIMDSSNIIHQTNLTVQGIMQKLSDVADQNASATEQSSASVEEQAAMIQQISDASESLATLAQELNDKISVFKF